MEPPAPKPQLTSVGPKAEDTIRFYSLRLREAGMIKATPNKIIAEGTDWHFFSQLKRELKG
jgi:NitT/TauT family transport system substrate-binding protein